MKKFLIVIASVIALICGALCFAACSGGTEYSVTCGDCENGYVTVSEAKAEAGEKVIVAAHPDAGYKLTSFVLDGEVMEGCSFVMPEKDVTVSATFEALTYSINYVLGDATVADGNPTTYAYGSTAQLIDPEKEGYEVCGWYTYCVESESYWNWDIEDFRVTSLEKLFGNLTLYAKYYNPMHSINISYSYGGECYVENYIYDGYYGETYDLIVNTYPGYELDYIEVNGERIEGTTFTIPKSDVEIYVEFEAIEYKINYVLDGGTNSPFNPDYYTVNYGDNGYFELSDAEKDGYDFWGWYLDEEHSERVYGINTYLCEDITLYAYFEEIYVDYE